MSLLTEYLKALNQAIKNPELVLEGWLNDIKLIHGDLPEDQVKEILRRRAICHDCPFMSINATLAGNYHSSRKDEHCIHCGCPITKKTASLESNCGIEIFNANRNNNPIPLKWEKYSKYGNDKTTEAL